MSNGNDPTIIDKLDALQRHVREKDALTINANVLDCSRVRKALTEIKLNRIMDQEPTMTEQLLLEILISRF